MNRAVFAVLACVVSSGVVLAQGRGVVPSQPAPTRTAPAITLKVGDKAPSLSVDSWIKGQPVSGLEAGKVYAVEFWATWCGPCIANIPHLNQIQKDRPDLTVIAVAASERPPAKGQPDKRLPDLQNFVRGKGNGMNYRVAYDAGGVMSSTWMRAAGQNGIPCAFVVDSESKIAWIGHPGSEAFEKAIDAALKVVKDKKGDDKPKGKEPAKAPAKKSPAKPDATPTDTAPKKDADPK
ncbi:MAG: hypothetical protein HBSAPP03_04560 [Phycisphaerae bacterium]|nr:MAG: hypothetical protein HBSAPP03_04560 [Phycisphaerae bacterium]